MAKKKKHKNDVKTDLPIIMDYGIGSISVYDPADIMGAPDKPCGVGRADANPKLLLNDT